MLSEPIRNVMERKRLVLAAPDTSVSAAARLMAANRVGAVMVIEGTRLVGIFTERDVMTRLDHSDLGWLHVPVRDVMTARPTAVHPDSTFAEALRLLNGWRRRHLPVVDARGRVLGILSIRDLLAHMATSFPDDFVNLPPDPDHEASGEWGG